jgi:hypothetical protein
VNDTDPMPGLTQYDRRWVLSAERVPVPRGEPAPFDRAAAYAAWREGAAQPAWLPHRFAIPRAMERAEAVFWFYALTSSPAAELRDLDTDRAVGKRDVVERVCAANRSGYEQRATSDVMQPLAHLFDPFSLIGLINDEEHAIALAPYMRGEVQNALACGFCDHVAPFLNAADFAAIGGRMREALAQFDGGEAPFHLYHLAASLRLSDALPPYFAARLRGRKEQRLVLDTEHLVYALGSREQILAETKRHDLWLESAQAVREWLAVTGRKGISYAFRAGLGNGRDVAIVIEALGSVHITETAAAMLGLSTRKDYAEHAKAWLDRHPELAVPAAAAAVAKGTRVDAAVETLKRAAALGHRELIEAHASATLRAIVLGSPGSDDSSGGDDDLSWLDDARPRRKPIPWLYADALPPLVVAGGELDDRQVEAVIDALRTSTLVAPHPHAIALKRHASAANAERFALALLHQWLRSGAVAADKWALFAVGLFGGDEAATALVPLVRRWPGESQHARAVIGLECLRRIGSDVALTQIAGLAQKLSFAALKKRANECLEEIARERDLTRDRLEDRIVPALDLAGGERQFAVRGQAYTVVLNDALEPVIRDAHGKTVRDLPKRADGESAEDDAARAEWKLFKKQLRDVAKIQVGRLEAAMVSQRSWFNDEFGTLLVAHPIVGHLVRRLVWIAEGAGSLAMLFRVLNDGTTVNVDDVPVPLPAAGTIRIAHRLELDEREVDAWEARFAAARIEQPFHQLDRVTYSLDDVELAAGAIHRFDGVPVVEPVILGRLRTRGWQRGTPEDAGGYAHHWKRFEKAGVIALLQHDMIFIGSMQPDARVALAGCSFIRAGEEPHPYGARTIPLRDLSAVAISEVCADCSFVLS